jgi:hypothetical protein
MQKLNNIPFKLPIVSYNGGGGNSNSSSSTAAILTILDGTETLDDEEFEGQPVKTFTLTSSQTFVIIQPECQAEYINLASFSSYGNINLTFINNGETTNLKVSSNNNVFVYNTAGGELHTTFELPESTTTSLTVTYDKTSTEYRCYSIT